MSTSTEGFFSLADRTRINAENRAKYEAAQQRLAEEAAAKTLARSRSQKERLARAPESSCGSTEQTGNPRKGCDCEACVRRRTAKSAKQREARQLARGWAED